MTRPNACRALFLSLILTVATGAASAHQLSIQDTPTWTAATPSGKAGPGLAFDWFSNAAQAAPAVEQADTVRAVTRRHPGHGSWICSPAGGGMASSCFSR